MTKTAKTKPPKPPAPKAPDALRQVAALPLRSVGGGLEVLLLTSRETHRWVIPKGWPMRKKTDAQAAATEAVQEAGVVGEIGADPIGAFSYFKRRDEHFDLVDVVVYRLDVTRQKKSWKEKAERDLLWCSLADAAALVHEPGLKALLLDLADRLAPPPGS